MRTICSVGILLVGLFGAGCASQPSNSTITTISNGSHIFWTDEQWKDWEHGKKTLRRYVVWGDHQGVTSTVTSALQQNGQSVVERARLQEVFNEQKIVLTHTAEDYSDVFRVGRLLGADVVVFAESELRHDVLTVPYQPSTSERIGNTLLGMSAGGGNQQALGLLQLQQQERNRHATNQRIYHVGVSVRAVKIESGEILWNGASRMSHPITDPETALILLTSAAMHRAVCPLERGAKWTEFRGDKPEDPWGCSK
jgi:hypothetical protein